jgi:hypothetical protein
MEEITITTDQPEENPENQTVPLPSLYIKSENVESTSINALDLEQLNAVLSPSLVNNIQKWFDKPHPRSFLTTGLSGFAFDTFVLSVASNIAKVSDLSNCCNVIRFQTEYMHSEQNITTIGNINSIAKIVFEYEERIHLEEQPSLKEPVLIVVDNINPSCSSFPTGSYHPSYSYIVNNINNFVRQQSLGYFATPPVTLIVNSSKLLNENLGEIIRVENFDVEYHRELFNNKESLKYFFNQLEIDSVNDSPITSEEQKQEVIDSIINDLPQFHPTVDNLIKFVNAYNSNWLSDKTNNDANKVKSLYSYFMRKFYRYYPEEDNDEFENY